MEYEAVLFLLSVVMGAALFLFKRCSILLYKYQTMQKRKGFKTKRISQVEKVKKKEKQKKNNE